MRQTQHTEAAIPLASSLMIIIVSGCLIATITFGLRSAFGLFVDPLSSAQSWGREVFAVAAAIQNLLWGISQPIAGALADRYGPGRVLAAGGVLYGLGMALMAYSTTPLALHLTAGILVGVGMGGASYITVLGAFGKLVPEAQRSWALGLGTAAGSLGQFLVVPLGQAFITAYGWQMALVLLGGLAGLVPLFASSFGVRKDNLTYGSISDRLSLTETLRLAFNHRSYQLLVAGFFVCGFQLAFITIHMPPYLNDVGIGATVAAWAIGCIGLFNVIGAYGSGVIGGRWSKKNLLSLIYFGRAVATALFIALPVTEVSVFLYAAVMGLLWMSTAPPTSGLVAIMFGTRYMTTLFGLVFFSHQLGSFLGVWLGGALFAHTGSYEVVWWMMAVLGMAAALVNLPIAETPAPHLAGARG